ncbi:MAG TPA: hypothetical protein VFY65_00080 [Longimicrobium sp.]|nr:hypothetical protein [Longimicrobium sp.]
MRLFVLATAALCVAAPLAAQQPDPDSIGRAVMEQILANQGDVRDYTLVLVHGAVRMPAYVHRDGELWQVQGPTGHPMADLLTIAGSWPNMASEVLYGEGAEAMPLEDGATYLGIEEVDGRRAHVVGAGFDDAEEVPDSMRLYMDVETRQLLRIAMSAPMGEQDGGTPLGSDLRLLIDLADYATRDGLTLPTRMRLRMSADLELSPDQRERARAEIAGVRATLEQAEGDEAAQTRAMMVLLEGLLLRGEVDMAVRVEDVRVNSGPPAWLEGAEEP